MAGRKMIKTKFGSVPQELYDKIESLRYHPLMLSAVEKLEGLRADLKTLHKNIQKYSTEDDAQALLDGDSLEENKGITKSELIRKREALERAINIQTFEIQKLENRLIKEGLEALEPLGRKYAKETIDALSLAEKAMRKQSELFVVLRMRGFKQMNLPAKWQTPPIESQLLSGGRFPSLALHLQKRRELWGFPAVGKHLKA